MGESKIIGHVLVVDDEESILHLFRRDFFRTNIEIHTAKNYDEAVKVVEDHPIDIVMSDLKMQRIDGIETLKKFRISHPDIHRILISGIVEKPEVIKAITNGTASAFISKPWNREVLLNRIEHIMQNRKLLRRKELVEVIQNIGSLPALPNIYMEFMEAYNNDASIKEISALLHRDASLTTEVLRIANSAYYGSIEISNLKQGILHLGLKYVKDIVFTVSVINQMKWTAVQLTELQDLFQHSIRVNRYLSRFYQLKYNEQINNNYSSAGVLHDIGKIVLLQYFPDRYFQIKKYLERQGKTDWYAAEHEMGFDGCTHADIGGFFLDHWNFPEINVEMALNHHTPDKSAAYMNQFMYALRFVNEFITSFDSGRLKNLEDIFNFMYDDLPPHELEQLYFCLLDAEK